MNEKNYIKILTAEILEITLQIQVEFPELYKLLNETPLFLSFQKSEITTENLEEYLYSLKDQKKTFEENEHLNFFSLI